MPTGKIQVTLLNAQGLHDAQTFGKQDPYCVVQVGQTHYRGKTASNQGVNPTFNQQYSFQVNSEMDLLITVWNSNTLTGDDDLGSVTIPLAKCYEAGSDDVHAQISRKGRSKGQIHVILRFEADGSAPATQAQLPPPLTPEQIKAQAEVKAQFDKYDTQHVGGIDKNGFHQLLSEMGFFSGLPTEKQQQLVHAQFDAADTSKDGWIDFNEFAVLYNRLLDSMRNHPKAQAYIPENATFLSPLPPPAASAGVPTAPPVYPGSVSGGGQAPPAYPPQATGGYPTTPGCQPPTAGGYGVPHGGMGGYPATVPSGYGAPPGGSIGYSPAVPSEYGASSGGVGGYPPAAPCGYGAPSGGSIGYPPQASGGYGTPSGGAGGYPHAAPGGYGIPPGGGYGVPPGGGYGAPSASQYGVPSGYGAPPAGHGYGAPVPAYYGAPTYVAAHYGGKKYKHKGKKYKHKKYKHKGGKSFGMGAMGLALGGGLVAGLLLDDIFD